MIRKNIREFKKQREAREYECTKQTNTMTTYFTKSPFQAPSACSVSADFDKNNIRS